MKLSNLGNDFAGLMAAQIQGTAALINEMVVAPKSKAVKVMNIGAMAIIAACAAAGAPVVEDRIKGAIKTMHGAIKKAADAREESRRIWTRARIREVLDERGLGKDPFMDKMKGAGFTQTEAAELRPDTEPWPFGDVIKKDLDEIIKGGASGWGELKGSPKVPEAESTTVAEAQTEAPEDEAKDEEDEELYM